MLEQQVPKKAHQEAKKASTDKNRYAALASTI